MNPSNKLVFGKELCTVPDYLLEFLKDQIEYCCSNLQPDLITNTYRQWNLHLEQDRERTDNPTINWISEDCRIIDEFFADYVKKVFRFRLSILEQGGNIDWHAGHRYPRIHIPLNSINNEFIIQDLNGIKRETISMQYGKAYMINVSLPHSVATINAARLNAFFCFDEFVTEELTNNFTAT